MSRATGRADQPLTPTQRDLRQLAANYHLGAALNAIDQVGVRRGGDRLPATARMAAWALRLLLEELGLVDPGGVDRAVLADVWSSE